MVKGKFLYFYHPPPNKRYSTLERPFGILEATYTILWCVILTLPERHPGAYQFQVEIRAREGL